MHVFYPFAVMTDVIGFDKAAFAHKQRTRLLKIPLAYSVMMQASQTLFCILTFLPCNHIGKNLSVMDRSFQTLPVNTNISNRFKLKYSAMEPARTTVILTLSNQVEIWCVASYA